MFQNQLKLTEDRVFFSELTYISTTTVPKEVEDFQLRDDFHLNQNNPWVILSKWD